MIGVGIELRLDCPACDNAVHINAMTVTAECPSCLETLAIPIEHWRDLLEEVWDEIPDYARGRGGRSQAFQGQRPASNILYARFAPYCFDCKTDFDMAALWSAYGAAAGIAHCHGCGKPWHVRPPSAPIKAAFPHIALLVGEDETLLPGNPTPAPRSARPVVFQCPSCSAPLSIDGSQRVVPCQFCSVDVYLPDDLWRRLHPVSKLRRWFVWWNSGGRVRDPSRFPD